MRTKIRDVEELSLAETNAIIDELEHRLSSWIIEDSSEDDNLDGEFIPDALPRFRSKLPFDEVKDSS